MQLLSELSHKTFWIVQKQNFIYKSWVRALTELKN